MPRMIACLALACSALASAAAACDTPVYRYAMYRWESSPYEVYLFHEADLTAAEQAVVAAFDELAARRAPSTNAMLALVDLRQENALAGLPRDVQHRWEQRADKTTPAYLTVSPQGGLVSWRPLTVEAVAALVDSPVRQQIAGELAAAKGGLFLLLTTGNPLADQAAQQELEELERLMRAGEIEVYQPPAAGDQFAQAQNPEALPPLELGYVTLNRNDPREQWLIDTLLAVESDLRELDQPMVFPIYGRGRALPPYVGAGIKAENLADAVIFLTGACSCTVKEQNPGVDLLMSYDWEAAAEAMKDRFGNEEGNETFDDAQLFPQLVIPGETGTNEAPTRAAPEQAVSQAVRPEPLVASAALQPTHQAELIAPESQHGQAEHASGGHTHAGPAASSRKLLYTLGAGVGLGIMLLALGTFFVFRHE